MSEAFPPSEQPEQPASAPEDGARKRRGLVRLVPRRRGARWAAVGAAVVLVGGGAAAAAVVEHHHEHGGKEAVSRADADHENGDGRGHDGHDGHDGKDERRAGKPGEMRGRGASGGHGEEAGAGYGPWNGRGPRTAPAPLPALPLSQAADKAAAAVTGGKVESLRVVGQEGGGSSWLAVVLGPDGVRHAVTLSGADGTVTGNTTVGAGGQ
ncbi:hypothetical protein ABT084_20245 [Streptomyces sp. NPDC002138]|uniref:hypothetical protein n=1 Tax=Streptomyces sp. NPDC002138 TaxID=3154410 RepID=UPI00332DB8A3